MGQRTADLHARLRRDPRASKSGDPRRAARALRKEPAPESSVDLTVSQPSIYFGELSSDYVFVKTNAREFHYPKGDDNVYTTYDGESGVTMEGWFRQLMFGVRFRSLKLLLSDDITSESRVLFYRRLGARCNRIAPFLEYDADPYLVLSDTGRLVWMQDAYTLGRPRSTTRNTSGRFRPSRPATTRRRCSRTAP